MLLKDSKLQINCKRSWKTSHVWQARLEHRIINVTVYIFFNFIFTCSNNNEHQNILTFFSFYITSIIFYYYLNKKFYYNTIFFFFISHQHFLLISKLKTHWYIAFAEQHNCFQITSPHHHAWNINLFSSHKQNISNGFWHFLFTQKKKNKKKKKERRKMMGLFENSK
jgi:hypothetical protein